MQNDMNAAPIQGFTGLFMAREFDSASFFIVGVVGSYSLP